MLVTILFSSYAWLLHHNCSEDYYFVSAERRMQIAAQGVPLERNTQFIIILPTKCSVGTSSEQQWLLHRVRPDAIIYIAPFQD
jgi:hypothetical protein